MIDLSSGHATQLGLALLLGVILFVMAYALPERKIIGFLIIIIPFQLIMSRYGSLNMVLTYLIGFSLILKGRINYFPLLPVVLAILTIYFISTFMALRPTWLDHLLYIISIISNFVLFYMVYNFFRSNADVKFAFKLLVLMNILVVAYGLIQIVIGPEKFAFLSIDEFSFASNLTEKQRLVGTFGAPGINGEYFALNILLLGYILMNGRDVKIKILVLGLMLANFGLLVATGSRGSFLVLMGGILLFLWFYRKQLGALVLIRVVAVGSLLFTLIAVIIINYTDFNVLFERLSETELTDSGVPDTRKHAFDLALDRIPDAMIVGHGPQLRLINEESRLIIGYKSMPGYPHNLYLFLLYTLGFLGLLTYMVFFFSLYFRFWRGSKQNIDDSYLRGIPTLGMLLLIVFLVDQLKIEFLRLRVNDMQHYLFTLWAILLAFTDLNQNKISQNNVPKKPEKAENHTIIFPGLRK